MRKRVVCAQVDGGAWPGELPSSLFKKGCLRLVLMIQGFGSSKCLAAKWVAEVWVTGCFNMLHEDYTAASLLPLAGPEFR